MPKKKTKRKKSSSTKHPSKSNLSFGLSGKMSPGCKYGVISWRTGAGDRRMLASCHRKLKAARETLRKVKKVISRDKTAGIYNLKTGKKVA